jgi:predicted alpha/beta hydrolase
MRPATSTEPTVASSHIDLTIPARDGYPLAARLWVGRAGPLVAVINGGAGIVSTYYDRFAAFLAAEGTATVVYDYRGIGRSRPKKLRGFVASVEAWGSKDCAGVVDWLMQRFPEQKRLLIGHSVGGFLTGFAENARVLDTMVLIGAHTGYWRDYAPSSRASMYALWHVFMPLATALIGFFPGRALKLGDDLPAGVARDWANRREGDFWWYLRNPDGTADVARRDALLARFHGVRARTLAVRFTDDPFATDVATRRLLDLYANAAATTLAMSPGDAGDQPIGHFGFFRSRMRDTLWKRLVSWLSETPSAETVVCGRRASVQ